MSAHFQGSGPRSNAYSENKFTNWELFDPFSLEVKAVHGRFNKRIAAHPKQPRIIVLPPSADFQQPCTESQILHQLTRVQPEYLRELRAIYVLPGTKKQLLTWRSSVAAAGCYWRNCIFLHAYPWIGWMNLDQISRFYLDDVLLHEIGHHADRFRIADHATKEGYARFFPIGHSRVPAAEMIPPTPTTARHVERLLKPVASQITN
jgi:hypothetical protein